MPYIKFSGVWLIMGLISGAILFFLTGSTDSLSATFQAAQNTAANCENVTASAAQITREDCLQGLTRTLEREAEQIKDDLIFWHAILAVLVLAIGIFFMFLIVRRNETAGTEEDFRALKDSWYVYLAVIILVTITATYLARVIDFFGRWPINLDPTLAWGLPVMVGLFWGTTYWLGTKLGTPSKMQPSIPFGA